MKNFSVQGPGGSIPNPKGFGFSWKPLQMLVAEHQRLWSASREATFKAQELRDRIAVMEREEATAMARAVRSGKDEPDGADLGKAKDELGKAEKRSAALRQILQQVRREIVATVREHGEGWAVEARAEAASRAKAVEDAVARLREAQGELSAYAALVDWLERPERSFGFGPGPSHVDTFGGANVNVGEVLDALVREAELATVAPEERQRIELARAGIITTNAPAWEG